MTKEKLKELLNDGNFDEVVKAVSVKPKKKDTKYKNSLSPLEEYNVEDHPVFDSSESGRPDVWIKNEKGERIRERKVNRIGLAFEQMIAGRAAAFLCANPVIYRAVPDSEAENRMWEAFKKVNQNNKLDFKNQNILEKRMSELEVAEIWYLDELEEDDDYWAGTDINPSNKKLGKPRLFIAATSFKDELYPVWSGQENLIGFARKYIELTDEGKEVEHFDLYTEETIYEATLVDGKGWTVESNPNIIKKIPAVYHSQSDAEWGVVRSEIRRLENISSNLGDSNDKVMSPILFVEGELTSLPENLTGRVLKGSKDTKVTYVTADNAPEATKLEVDNLFRFIYTLTDTPDISFDNLKGSGTTSGFALEMMFMGAHLKASKHSGTFGECVQRRINLIKKMLVVIDTSLKEGMSLKITPTFDFFLPKDVGGVINYLSTATSGERPLLSQETGVNILQGTIGGDGQTELERITEQSGSTENTDTDINS